MDFDVDQSAGLHFVYVLPTSPTEALVENVYLADSAVGTGQHRAEIADYLHQRYGLAKDEWTITGQEAGFIPMTDFVFPTRSGERIFTLGTRGGQTRAASGYTFVRVQRQAQQLAAHIAGDLASSGLANLRPGPGDATPARFHTLDGIFLAYLTRFPQAGPDLFARLAGAVDGDTFARFMTEATTPKEELDIVLSLPILPFVGVAGRRLLDSTIKRLRKKMAPSAGQSTPRAKSAPGRTLAPAPALAQPFRKGPHVH
jgi:lycopene beta-cyclase